MQKSIRYHLPLDAKAAREVGLLVGMVLTWCLLDVTLDVSNLDRVRAPHAKRLCTAVDRSSTL